MASKELRLRNVVVRRNVTARAKKPLTVKLSSIPLLLNVYFMLILKGCAVTLTIILEN